MKIHTTNYKNCFIEIATDCPIQMGETPPVKDNKKSVANMQFDLLHKQPYKFTSDEILFTIFAERNELTKSELTKARADFFSKGQPCFRASPLTKQYGWGIHFDNNEKMAIYAVESTAYNQFITDKKLTIIKAMRSKK
jgi:Family of unknown function (DUF6157)